MIKTILELYFVLCAPVPPFIRNNADENIADPGCQSICKVILDNFPSCLRTFCLYLQSPSKTGLQLNAWVPAVCMDQESSCAEQADGKVLVFLGMDLGPPTPDQRHLGVTLPFFFISEYTRKSAFLFF